MFFKGNLGMTATPQLTFWQICNMCFGFLGIQFGFALQTANVSRIFETLGAKVEDIPMLWIAAPLTGLIVQPVIGYLSDRTWTPLGRRRIATVAGGEFHGERLRGIVVGAPVGDWLLQRRDGVTVLDVRLLLRTEDGEHIYMSYRGLRHGPPEVMARLAAGETVDPGSYYFRIAPVFETAATNYAWLNRIIAVGTGRREPAARADSCLR